MVAVAPLPTNVPARDGQARARLQRVGDLVTPTVLARSRQLVVAGPIGEQLLAGGVQRGTTIALDGPTGSGSTTVACTLAAAATSAGEWAAVVDPDGTLGACAASENGVALERLAVVRRVPRDRWATVVAALLDGVALVVAAVPPWLRAGDARRLTARARERAAVLVALGPWPASASLRLHTEPSTWSSLDIEQGVLTLDVQQLRVHVEGTAVRPTARAG
jgi:hypothetical protein